MKLRLRQLLYIVMAIAAFVLLIVVVINSQSPESLMTPPEAAGDYKDIQEVIKDSVNSGIILKAPNEGEYTTAITFADLNLDGENDAIAFYRLNNDDTSSIYMSVLLKNGSKWIAASPIKGKGNDILEFSFGDLDYDSVPEIIVGWNMFDSKDNNSLCVYSVQTQENEAQVKINDSLVYTKMFVEDICREGKKEILVVKNNFYDTVTPAKATVYELVDGKLQKVSSADMSGSVSEYIKIQTQSVDSNNVFLLDGTIEKERTITEILFWDESTRNLVNASYDADGALSNRRSGTLISIDINADGVIEIPKNDTESGDEMVTTFWRQFDFDSYTNVCQSVCTQEWVFVFPEQWNNNIRVRNKANVLSFYDISSGDEKKLFDLISCDLSEKDSLFGGYEKLKIDYGTIYGVKFADSNSDLQLSKNEIKDAILNIR